MTSYTWRCVSQLRCDNERTFNNQLLPCFKISSTAMNYGKSACGTIWVILNLFHINMICIKYTFYRFQAFSWYCFQRTLFPWGEQQRYIFRQNACVSILRFHVDWKKKTGRSLWKVPPTFRYEALLHQAFHWSLPYLPLKELRLVAKRRRLLSEAKPDFFTLHHITFQLLLCASSASPYSRYTI